MAPELIEVSVPADGETAEALCELFERYGGGAVVEIQVRGPDEGSSGGEPQTWVRTYLPADDISARRRLEEGLWHLGRIHPIPEAAVRELAEANWAERWKDHYTPQRIGQHFVIVPSWLETTVDIRPDDHVIRLDPGMAFGTGLHPTTRLCLAAIETRVQPGDRVLDVGTGSGILAIGAAKLGAAVTAVDIDPRAVRTAAENAAANDTAIETQLGSPDAVGGTFDLVAANLLAGTVIELADVLAARTAPSGVLVASGVLDEQTSEVADALVRAGLATPTVNQAGDWVALVTERPA